jgi:hypothetical protein
MISYRDKKKGDPKAALVLREIVVSGLGQFIQFLLLFLGQPVPVSREVLMSYMISGTTVLEIRNSFLVRHDLPPECVMKIITDAFPAFSDFIGSDVFKCFIRFHARSP